MTVLNEMSSSSQTQGASEDVAAVTNPRSIPTSERTSSARDGVFHVTEMRNGIEKYLMKRDVQNLHSSLGTAPLEEEIDPASFVSLPLRVALERLHSGNHSEIVSRDREPSLLLHR